MCLINDMFPNDVAMWLENTLGTEVYAYVDNLPSDEFQYKQFQRSVAFDEAVLEEVKEMKFVITDAYGDGLTMYQGSHDKGKYWLVWGEDCDGGEKILEGNPDFGFVEETYFSTSGTCEGNGCVSVDFEFDGFPTDITYSVKCGNSTLRDNVGPLNASFKNKHLTDPVFIPESNVDDCNVTIHDIHGDGLCCTHGSGYASVYLGSAVNGTLIGTTGNESFTDFSVNVQRNFASTER